MTKEEIIRNLKYTMEKHKNDTVRTFDTNISAMCKDILDYLEQEPKMEWIPVSERLPEDHKDVLICLSSDQICIGCHNSHRLPFSNNAIGWGTSYTHNWCSDDVIAWMPLPEPYKKGGE